MDIIKEELAALVPRMEAAAHDIETAAAMEDWAHHFVGDVVRVTIPDSYVDIRKRANPQEERKDAPTFREEVKIIFDQFHEFLCDFEHRNHAQREKLNSQI